MHRWQFLTTHRPPASTHDRTTRDTHADTHAHTHNFQFFSNATAMAAVDSCENKQNTICYCSRKALIVAMVGVVCAFAGLSIGLYSLFKPSSDGNFQDGTPLNSKFTNAPTIMTATHSPTKTFTQSPTLMMPDTTFNFWSSSDSPSWSLSDSPTAAPTVRSSPNPSPDPFESWHAVPISKQDGAQFQVVEELYHDTTAFTQGLTLGKNVLYESTGGYGRSTVRRIHPDTGEVLQQISMPRRHFGEGMAYAENNNGDELLVQLTWTSRQGFIYNASNLSQPPRPFWTGTTLSEGWGIAHNPAKREFVASDGTHVLHFWNATALLEDNEVQELRTVEVTRLDGTTLANELNELEWWRDRILANVWYEYVLLVIHPETGQVEKEYDFSSIYPNPPQVFNGISISDEPDVLYVTGKNWDKMFKIRLLPLL